MSAKPIEDANQSLLNALLDSWDRNNTILINLLRAIPEEHLKIRATDTSAPIGALFSHIHFVRLVFIAEDAPEFDVDYRGSVLGGSS